eukprot:3754772-Prymnesium_polylepis.1
MLRGHREGSREFSSTALGALRTYFGAEGRNSVSLRAVTAVLVTTFCIASLSPSHHGSGLHCKAVAAGRWPAARRARGAHAEPQGAAQSARLAGGQHEPGVVAAARRGGRLARRQRAGAPYSSAVRAGSRRRRATAAAATTADAGRCCRERSAQHDPLARAAGDASA